MKVIHLCAVMTLHARFSPLWPTYTSCIDPTPVVFNTSCFCITSMILQYFMVYKYPRA